jgi:hypothetical protein
MTDEPVTLEDRYQTREKFIADPNGASSTFLTRNSSRPFSGGCTILQRSRGRSLDKLVEELRRALKV